MTSVATSTQSTRDGGETELRTFLFADVRGYTRFTQERGDHAAAELVSKFASVTRKAVESRGGILLELRGDEALAVFTSARQALQTAVALQARYGEESAADPSLPLPVGIGLDAGEAVPFEGGYRGEALNLASRLCNLAGPGEVLATEGLVYLGRRVRGVSYAERGTLQIKGFAEPVRVIRVLPNANLLSAVDIRQTPAVDDGAIQPEEGPIPIGGFLGALPSGVLVGREGEWDHVMASLETVMQGSGQLVMLSGEPGIGKTRLAQEVTLKARHWGFLVATGRCYEQEQSVPYYPFLEALVTLHGSCSPSVRAEVPRRWPQLGRLLPEQVGIAPPAAFTGLDGEDQHLLFRAVTGFIEAVAEDTPVALLLDDLHWADDASLKLLLHLARYTRGDRVLLLGTYRDVEIYLHHPLELALLDLGREGLLEEVEIHRLGPDETAALVAEVLGAESDVADLSDLVYRRTDGNAFFVQEMLRALVERGDLYQEDGRWERRATTEIEIPKSIRSVIGQRLSRLDDRAQEILREASVIGQTFSFDDLVALGVAAPPALSRLREDGDQSGWMEDEVEAALEQATRSGLVRETGPETYAFNHALTQAALYADLSTRRRKRLHLAAGQALARLPERDRERRVGEIAWHFLEADDAEQALRYSTLAGDRAAEVFANQEADYHYRTALELARELDDRDCEVQSLEKLAGILAIEAKYEEALHTYDEAARLYHAAGDLEGEARVVAQTGQIHYLQDTADEGIPRLQALVESLEDSNGPSPSPGRAALWAALGYLYMDTGRYEEQLSASERAVEIAREIGDDSLLLGAEVTRSDALWRLRQQDDALRTMEELIPRAEATRDLYNLARALGHAAGYYARRGEMDKDREYRERMLEVAERRGDRGQIALALLALSANAFTVGDWVAADAYLQRVEEIVRSLGTTRLAIWPLAARGWLALRTGDQATASACAEQVLSLAMRPTDLAWVRHMYRLLAEQNLAENRAQEALDYLTPGQEQPGWKRDVGFLSTLAWTRADLGQEDDGRSLASLAVRRAREQGRQDALVESLVIEGAIAAQQQEWQSADDLLLEACSVARSVPFLYGEGRAVYELARLDVARGNVEAARDRFRESLDIFERLGAKDDETKAGHALDSLAVAT